MLLAVVALPTVFDTTVLVVAPAHIPTSECDTVELPLVVILPAELLATVTSPVPLVAKP
jgi:hypothetical protein